MFCGILIAFLFITVVTESFFIYRESHKGEHVWKANITDDIGPFNRTNNTNFELLTDMIYSYPTDSQLSAFESIKHTDWRIDKIRVYIQNCD